MKKMPGRGDRNTSFCPKFSCFVIDENVVLSIPICTSLMSLKTRSFWYFAYREIERSVYVRTKSVVRTKIQSEPLIFQN